MMPSLFLEKVHYGKEFFLDLLFIERVFFPIFGIELILEHIDARVCYEGKVFVKFVDICERFSGFRVGKSKDEVDIDGDLLVSWFVDC